MTGKELIEYIKSRHLEDAEIRIPQDSTSIDRFEKYEKASPEIVDASYYRWKENNVKEFVPLTYLVFK